MAGNVIAAFWNSARVTLRTLWRVSRQLFHEATGTLFTLFAVYGVLAVWRQWTSHRILWLMGFAVIYAAMMALFALGAFRRARRIR
jgi:hypothetical protein